MRVEFIGGPLDGDIRELPDESYEWRVLLPSPVKQWWGEQGEMPAATPSIRRGSYRSTGHHRHQGKMFWQGEE